MPSIELSSSLLSLYHLCIKNVKGNRQEHTVLHSRFGFTDTGFQLRDQHRGHFSLASYEEDRKEEVVNLFTKTIYIGFALLHI